MLSGPRGALLLCRSLRWHYPDSGSTGLISAANSAAPHGELVSIGRAQGSGKPSGKRVVGHFEISVFL